MIRPKVLVQQRMTRILKAEQLLADMPMNDLTTGQVPSRVYYLDQARLQRDKLIMCGASLLFASPLWALPLYDLFMLRQTFWPLFIGAAGMSLGVATLLIHTLLIHTLRARTQYRINLVLARMSS